MIIPMRRNTLRKYYVLAVDWAGFYPGGAILYSTKSGPGQNGPSKKRPGLKRANILAVIVRKWADFVSFLDQNGEVKIIMSLILHLDTGKIQNTYYEIHF